MTMFIKFTVHVYSFYTLSCSINLRKKCLFGIGSVFEVFEIWGAFRIRGNFQILGGISYIMYIFITSDVNKIQHFWRVFFDHRYKYMQKTLYSSQNFTTELRYAYEIFWLEIESKIYLSLFSGSIEKVTDSCTLNPGQI